MLRVRQVSEMLGVSPALVYELVSQGRIDCYRIGTGRGAIRFKEEDVQAYLKTCRVEGAKAEGEVKKTRPRLKHIKL
jgi:excisionase family DNA binding protein